MRIAITGASGLIGSALTSSLEDDGHDVVAVVRRRPAVGEVRWDPAAGELDAAGLEGLDGVVHLAGAGIAERRWTEDRKQELLESRTKSTTLLADALASLSAPPPVLVGGSAIGWYGDRPGEVLTEADEQGGGFLADLVAQWEASYAPAEAAGIRVAKARTGIVLARDGGALKPQLPLFKLGLGGRLGPGGQVQSWITLDDEVRALRFLLEHDVAGPVNLTAPNPVTNGEMAKAIGRAVHRPVVLPTPTFGPKLLFGSQLVEELLLYSQDVRPAALQEAGFEHHDTDLDEALTSVLA
jgi:uncharacterized protein (TIGR01777 family)